MYDLVLTALGLEKLTNLKSIDLSSVVVGSGEITPSLTTTDLLDKKATIPITKISKDVQDSATLVIEANMGVEVGGFEINEIGVIDGSGNLFAVGRFPRTYKPSIDESSAKAIKLLIKIKSSNADKIELKVDNTKVYATIESLIELKTGTNLKLDLKADKTALESYALKTELPTDFYARAEVDEKISNIDLSPYALKTEIPSDFYARAEVDAKLENIDLSSYTLKADHDALANAALGTAKNATKALEMSANLESIRKGNVGNIVTKFYPIKKENSFSYFVCDGAPILKEEYPELYEYSKNITNIAIMEDAYHFYLPKIDNSVYTQMTSFINHGRRNTYLSFKKSEIYNITVSNANINQGQNMDQGAAKQLFSFKLKDDTEVKGFPKGMNAYFKYGIDANKIGIQNTVLVLDYETEKLQEIPIKIEVLVPEGEEAKPYTEAKIEPKGTQLMPENLIPKEDETKSSQPNENIKPNQGE